MSDHTVLYTANQMPIIDEFISFSALSVLYISGCMPCLTGRAHLTVSDEQVLCIERTFFLERIYHFGFRWIAHIQFIQHSLSACS